MFKKLILTISFFTFFSLFVGVTPSEAQISCPVTPASSNSATFNITIPVDSTYTFWGRMIAPNASNNSLFLQVDGGCAIVVGDSATIPANQLTWVNYKDGNTASPISMNLTAGAHTIVLTERESGVGIDTLFFTDTTCVPTGFGNNCQGFVTPTPVPPTNTPIPSPTPLPTNTPTPTPTTQTYTLNPIADSYVNANSSGSNYGTRTTMIVDSSPVNVGYLKFDLTSLAGKTIVSANLRLRTGTDGSSNQQRVKSVSSTTWTETGIKYSNRPSLSSTVLGTINSNSVTNAWQQVSLTSTVAANTGRIFSLGIDSNGSNSITFSTRESTSKPELIIQAR